MAAVDGLQYRPVLLEAGDPELRRLLHEPCVTVFDEIDGQLAELLRSRHPARKFTQDELAAAVDEHLAGTPRRDYGRWVHYPWSRRLVHVLGEEEFVFLRTNRNVYKITPAEHAVLRTKKVGIIGLSVGQSIAMTLAMERSVGELRLADFDLLELTNLNRIRTGVHHLNVPKAVLVAREIAELDPYLSTVVFTDGVTADNIDEFFLGGGRLDAVVDECDGLDVKVLCRRKARELGIPVIMDASDRGTLDIERYDLEPDRPLLHGFLAGLDVDRLATLTTSEEKLPYILAFAQLDTLSSRMRASMLEIEQTVTTWPQLASAVALGGALGADVYRRMMLDQLHVSGRWFVDLEELIADPAPPSDGPASAPPPSATPASSPSLASDAELAATVRELGLQRCPGQLTVDRETVEALVHAAHLAPSGGNFQPWLWWHADGTLVLFHDDRQTAENPQVRALDHIGHGAALENLTLAAHAAGLEVGVRTFPSAAHPHVVAVVRFFPPGTSDQELEPHPADHLVQAIPARCTDRRLVPRAGIPTRHLAELVELVERDGDARLWLVTGAAELDEAADIVGVGDRLRLLDPAGHAAFYRRELRWTGEDAERTRDGIDVNTLDLTPSERVGIHIASDPRVVGQLVDWGGGGVFERLGRKAVASAGAVGVLVVGGYEPAAYLRAGRLTERLWLCASSAGLGLQPLTSALMHFHRLDQAAGEHLSAAAEVAALRRRFDALFGLDRGDVPMFLFRLVMSDPHAMRSHRRRLEEVLRHDG